jgi:hypothetical protein
MPDVDDRIIDGLLRELARGGAGIVDEHYVRRVMDRAFPPARRLLPWVVRIAAVALLCVSLWTLQAPPSPPWIQIIGTPGDERLVEVHPTPGGGCMAGGYIDVHADLRNVRALAVKFDSRGNLVWKKVYGSRNDVWMMNPSALTSDGGIVLAGCRGTYGDTQKLDACILRLNSAGEILWQKSYRGPRFDELSHIRSTPDGGFICAGISTFLTSKDSIGRKIFFGPGVRKPGGQIEALGPSFEDRGYCFIWVLKIRSDGALEWHRAFEGTRTVADALARGFENPTGANFPEPRSVPIPDGYFLCGDTDLFGAGKLDAWVMKLDLKGRVVWQKAYGGPGWDRAQALAATPDGGCIVAGHTTSFGAGEINGWMFKLDREGRIEWQKVFGGPKRQILLSVDLRPDGGISAVGSATSFGAGDYDLWLLRFDRNGNLLRQRVFGGPEEDAGTFVEGRFLSGYTFSFGAAKADGWVLKLDENDNLPLAGLDTHAVVTDSRATVTDTQAALISFDVLVQDTSAGLMDDPVHVFSPKH